MSLPQLDDERIAAMRGHIMSEVDADRRRRRRRTRGAIAALGVVVVAGGLGATALTEVARFSASDSAGTPQVTQFGSAASPERGEAAADTGRTARGDDSPTGTVEEGREIIVRGTVRLITSDPARAADDVAAWVRSEGGRIDTRTDSGSPGAAARSTLTIRIPRAEVDTAVERLRDIGEVTSVSIDHTDVTAQTTDLDARIEALRASVQRLTELMENAPNTSRFLEAERMLTERQGELDSLVSQRKQLGEQVALATMEVSLSASPSAETPSGSSGFTGGLIAGWNALVGTVDGLVRVLGVLLPWLGAAGVLYGAWRLIRLLTRRPAG